MTSVDRMNQRASRKNTRLRKSVERSGGFRIALYIRVSTEEQAENPEGSIKNQEQRLREFVKLKNMIEPFGEVVDVFSDPGVSAKDMNRPGFQRMLKAIEEQNVDLVLVTEISRFSRSTRDFAMLQEFLEDHQCKFLSVRENFDTSGAAGQMVLNMMATIAEFERKQTAERISNSFHARAKRGLHNGGPVPLGYGIDEEKRGSLQIVPDESEIVKLIFKTFLREGSLAAAAKSLNEQKVRCPLKVRGGGGIRSKIFLIDFLYRVLRNKAYVGIKEFRVKGGFEESEAVWEPIIDRDSFSRAGRLLTENRGRRKTHGPNKFPYLLSGLLRCHECGERMAGSTATSQSGVRFAYYDHTATGKNEASLNKKLLKHSPRRIPVVKIEPVVWQEVKRLVLEEKFARALLEQARTDQGSLSKESRRKEFKLKRLTLERRIVLLAERIGKLPEDISADPLVKELGELQIAQKSLCEVEIKLDSKDRVIDPPASFESLEEFRDGLRRLVDQADGDPKVQSEIIKHVVDKILILKDGFEIHFYIGKTQIDRASGDIPGASFFSAPRKISKKNAAHGSRRLINGGLCKTRTCDLSHVKGTRYQLRQQTNLPMRQEPRS